ncbi:MAG: XdhC family protein [Maricaulaceae bacterium]
MSKNSDPLMPQLRTNFAHPTDVINFLHQQMQEGKACALIVVTGTDGGGVRAPGALAAVSQKGECAGYISNGCVDADMFAQAVEAINDDKARSVRYGAGSPFIDMRLPCGGAVDLMILPNPDFDIITALQEQLNSRHSVSFQGSIDKGLEYASEPRGVSEWQGGKFIVHCAPKLRLRIAGRGTEPIALMRAAHALDFDVILQSPDEALLNAATALGYAGQHLFDINQPPDCDDDFHTAFVMMFHDHDWEVEMLKQAVVFETFYIGALGGKKTHVSRCNVLRNAGVSESDIARIRGPIGLVASVRNASYLAVSVLAEIIDVYDHL